MGKVRENCRERLRHSLHFLISLTNHLISFKQWSHLGLPLSPLPTDIASVTPLIPLLTPHFMICYSRTHNCLTGHNHTTCPGIWKPNIWEQNRTCAACSGDSQHPGTASRAGIAPAAQVVHTCGWLAQGLGEEWAPPGSNSCKLSKGNRSVNLLYDHVMEESLTIQMCKPQGQGCEY